MTAWKLDKAFACVSGARRLPPLAPPARPALAPRQQGRVCGYSQDLEKAGPFHLMAKAKACGGPAACAAPLQEWLGGGRVLVATKCNQLVEVELHSGARSSVELPPEPPERPHATIDSGAHPGSVCPAAGGPSARSLSGGSRRAGGGERGPGGRRNGGAVAESRSWDADWGSV